MSIKRFEPRRKKRQSQPVQAVSYILPVVGKNLNLDQHVQKWSVLALWEQVVDPIFQGKTRAVKIKTLGNQNTLVVQADNAVIASELTFYQETYLQRLNQFAAQTALKLSRVEVRVGSK